MSLYEEIREKYPNPRSSRYGVGYCVGGALCHFFSIYKGFPTADCIERVLRRANPNLTGTEAAELAFAIVTYNDDEEFELAWTVLKNALERGEEG